MNNSSLFVVSLLAAALLACSGEKEKIPEGQESLPATASEKVSGGVETPDSGRAVIVVQMSTEADGTNRFDPANIDAHQGDVVRFTLGMGVHNVNFLPDSNVVKTGLPEPSPMLQLPGQTFDLKVRMPEGRYYFQCDPHAALGMKGYLKVEG